MSWFTDLAGKAESLLEKVDNTAANVLHVDDKNVKDVAIDTQDGHEPRVGDLSQTDSGTDDELRITRTASEGSLLRPGLSAPVRPRLPLSSSRHQPKTTKKEEKDDDQLFRFLNSNVPTAKEKKPAKPSPSLLRKNPELAQSSPVPVRNNGAELEDPLLHGELEDRKDSLIDDNAPNLQLDIPLSKEPPSQTIDHESPSPPAPSAHRQENDRVSNLELENKLLRKEVSSLNEEMVSQLQRVKEAEKQLQTAHQHLARSQKQLSTTELLVRQLRATEDDFNEALSAKDSQLAVLRVRIQQVDQELQEKKNHIQGFQVERERLLKDHTDSSGVHSHALDVVQTKVEDAERKWKMEQETRKKAQQEAMERQSKLENDQQNMAELLKNLQKKVDEEKTKANDKATALKNSKANLEAARQEMKDYKEKAGRILQAKDKVIATLRDGGHGDNLTGEGVSSAEFDEVCQERVALKEELNQARFRIEQTKTELQDMEQQHQSDADIFQEKLDLLQGFLQDEKMKRRTCEQEIQTHMEDMRFAQDEVQRNKTSFIGQIQERETEIQRLKNQIATKSLTSTSEAELENRVRALTENLIQKQTSIEALSTEKSSLVLQMERLEQQYRDMQSSSAVRHMNSSSVTLDSTYDSDENTLSHVKSITSVMPSKLHNSRKVKQAVNEIDKCSIRLGLFLRRYPIARLFVILYMFFLHLWVVVVLLTYKPEMHDSASMPHSPNMSYNNK